MQGDSHRSRGSMRQSDTLADVNALERERLREGPVRLLGYANEAGESFRPLVPRWVVGASYAVAGAYCTCDAAWRATIPPRGRSAAVEAGDTLLWQGLASVAIPGAVINRIVWAVSMLPTPPRTRAWLPTVTGLSCIPLIVKPIDHCVDGLMECLRPWYGVRSPGPPKTS